MEDRKKMHQSPSKPGASKQSKCLFMCSVFISMIRNAFAVIAGGGNESARAWLGVWARIICEVKENKPSMEIFLLFLWGISKQKQLLHYLFLPFPKWIICSWNCLNVNKCIHAVLLRISIYFDNHQYFPPPTVYIIAQSHHPSVHPSVQFSVTLLQNIIINASLIIIANSLLLFYPPSSNAYWQGWNGNYGLS